MDWEENRKLKTAIVLSIVIHLTFVAFLFLRAKYAEYTETIEKDLIWVEVTPPSATRNQVVQSDKGEKVKDAAPNAYLGKDTRVVRNQTSGRETIEGKAARSAAKPKVKTVPQVAPLAKLGVPMFRARTEREQRDLSTDQAFKQKYEQLSQDYVKGLKESETTALNTKEYVYFGYFQRIRSALDRAWRPILKARLTAFYRKGRSLASDMDYITKTLVTLDRSGKVIRVQVLEESGTMDLDQSAVNAFNEAGPFPNPPTGIIDPNGLIQVRWDFVLRT